ncbi:segregation and condensation protein A [Candidatus Omnitrophota bacterium]
MTYKVQLPVFEGPLDLLLYLIQKEELNIYDIPISKITEQYLEYLEVMKLLDLEIAGEFILMAATLMHIKSRMLLPVDENATDEITEEADPRDELVKKLLEYKKFKEAAGDLKEMKLRQRDSFTRLPGGEKPKVQDEDGYFEASLFDLITAFSKVLKTVPKDAFHKVIEDEFTVSDKIHHVLHVLLEKPTVYFSELFKGAKNKGEIVSIFLALLELIKLKEIMVKQKGPFEEIEVMRNPEWQKTA